MQDIIDLILSYARAVWMKRWYALLVAWLVCVIGWALVMRLPDQYEASARVNIDTQSFLKPLLRGLTFSTSPTQQIQLMISTLLSRPNLEKIARMTDLDLQVKTDQEMDLLLQGLKGDIKLGKESRQNLYIVKYENEDREVAKRVVQAVLTLFVENTLGENRQESVTARRFLDAEIKEYEQRLKDSEQRLVDFKRKNIGYLSAGSSDYYQRLQAAMGSVESSRLLLTEAKRQRDSIKEQVEDQEEELSFVFDLASADSVSTYDRRIEALESNLDAMFTKYTDKHPDVITLKAQLSELEEKREEELAAKAENSTVDNENPVLQSLKLSFSSAESQVAALEARVKAHQQKVENLQKLVHTIPAVEAELSDLNRDYGVIQKKHQELLQRREQATITAKASQASDDIEFKVIDPTRVPFEPSGPPRIIYMSAVLAGGLMLGVGFSLLLVILKPTYSSIRMLALSTGLPVLGSVSMVQDSLTISRNRRFLVLFFGIFFLLLIAYSALLLHQLLFVSQTASLF